MLLHPLVKGFALNGCFVGLSGDVAEESSHVFVDAVGLPDFPADFEVREERRIVKREEVVPFDVGIRKTIVRVVDPHLSLFLDPGGSFIGNELGSSG